MQKTLIIIFILLSGLTSSVSAGKYAAEFLTTGVGGRALGMGGAFVAIADDASATYWNPAGLTQLDRAELMLMHAEQFSGLLQTDVFNFVYPGKKYVIGLNYIRIGVDNIPYTSRRDLAGRPVIDKHVSDYEEAAFFSLGALLGQRLSLGVNFKAIRQSVGENSSLGFGFDVGLLYKWKAWSLGVNLQDITGTYIFWDTGHRDTRSPGVQIGAGYKKSLDFLRSSICLSLQQNIRFEGQNIGSQISFGEAANGDFAGGIEYTLLERLSLRIGSTSSNLALGAGVTIKMLRFDYAYMSHDLGNAHRVAAAFRF